MTYVKPILDLPTLTQLKQRHLGDLRVGVPPQEASARYESALGGYAIAGDLSRQLMSLVINQDLSLADAADEILGYRREPVLADDEVLIARSRLRIFNPQ